MRNTIAVIAVAFLLVPPPKVGAQDQPAQVSTNPQVVEHYRSGWLDHLGKPTGKEGWEIEAAGKAVEEFRKGLALEPGNKVLRVSLASALEKAKRTAEAEKEYQEAIRLDPKDPFLHFALGRLLALSPGSRDKAIGEFEEAVRLDPFEALFRYHLAHVLYEKAGAWVPAPKGQEYEITDEQMAETAFAQVRAGNDRTRFSEYLAPFPREFVSKDDYIQAVSLRAAESLPELTMMRDLARKCAALAKRYEARGEDTKALEVYQGQLILGKHLAGQGSVSMIKMLSGSAIVSSGYSSLGRFFSSRDRKEGVAWTEKGVSALKEITDLTRKQVSRMSSHVSLAWTEEENKLREENKGDFWFLEAPFVREMLARWPDIRIPSP